MSCVPWILPHLSDFEIDEFYEFKKTDLLPSSKTVERQRIEDARSHLTTKKEFSFSSVVNELASTCVLKPKEGLFLNDSPGMYAAFFANHLKKWIATKTSTQPLFMKSLRVDDDCTMTVNLDTTTSREEFRAFLRKKFPKGVSFITSNAYDQNLIEEEQVETMRNEFFTALDLQSKGGTFLCRIPRPTHLAHLQLLSILCKEYKYVSLLSPKKTFCSHIYVCAQDKLKEFDMSISNHIIYKQCFCSLLDNQWQSKVKNIVDLLEDERIKELIHP